MIAATKPNNKAETEIINIVLRHQESKAKQKKKKRAKKLCGAIMNGMSSNGNSVFFYVCF